MIFISGSRTSSHLKLPFPQGPYRPPLSTPLPTQPPPNTTPPRVPANAALPFSFTVWLYFASEVSTVLFFQHPTPLFQALFFRKKSLSNRSFSHQLPLYFSFLTTPTNFFLGFRPTKLSQLLLLPFCCPPSALPNP